MALPSRTFCAGRAVADGEEREHGNTFVARVSPPRGFAAVCDRLPAEATEVWAVIAVETSS